MCALHKDMRSVKTLIIAFVLAIFAAGGAYAQTPLTKLDGGTVDVEAQRGKVVVLAIGASWLPLSTKQAEYANTLARKYAGRNVVVYFVATDSTNAKSRNFAADGEIRTFAASNKLSTPVLRDPDGMAIKNRFGVDQVPSFLVLDKSGQPAGEAFGGIDPSFDITTLIAKKIDGLL